MAPDVHTDSVHHLHARFQFISTHSCSDSRCSVCSHWHQVVRAVKMLKGECSADAKDEFLREADTMLNFNHKNVTTIQGVSDLTSFCE